MKKRVYIHAKIGHIQKFHYKLYVKIAYKNYIKKLVCTNFIQNSTIKINYKIKIIFTKHTQKLHIYIRSKNAKLACKNYMQKLIAN